MADFIRRKKKIPSLEALDIDVSNIHIRRTRAYCYRPSSRTRKSVVLDDEVKIDESKPEYKIRCKTEPVRTMQAKSKPTPKPKPLSRVKPVRSSVSKARKMPPWEAKAYQPSQEEIQRATNAMRELERSRVKEMMDTDTRDEEF